MITLDKIRLVSGELKSPLPVARSVTKRSSPGFASLQAAAYEVRTLVHVISVNDVAAGIVTCPSLST